MRQSIASLMCHFKARVLRSRRADAVIARSIAGRCIVSSCVTASCVTASCVTASCIITSSLVACGTQDRAKPGARTPDQGIVAGNFGAEAGAAPSLIEVPSNAVVGNSVATPDAGAGLMAIDAGSTPAAVDPIPVVLSQIGLFEADLETLAPGVQPYEPRFPLWSDGAAKRRWVYLPEGAQIDTSNMEYWSYPPGTRLYKEFSVDGRKVETRLMQRQANGAWWFMSYQWRRDESEADAVPNGVVNALGTQHDIPSTEDCRTCHLRIPDKAIGFSAIQLMADREPVNPAAWTLARLQAQGKLTNAPPDVQLLPQDELGREGLGYLHGNCGHCHNPRSSVSSRVAINLMLRTDQLGAITETPAYLSTVGQPLSLLLDGPDGPLQQIIAPGSARESGLFLRASSRGEAYSMPPLSTKEIDPVAIEVLRQWIESLPPQGAAPAEPGAGDEVEEADEAP
jgi:hypothetical protein